MRIIRPRQAAEKCGIALPTLWAWAKSKPDFPQPIRLSGNATGFVEHELDTYLEKLVQESREQPEKRATAVRAATVSAASRRARRKAEAGHASA
jgi:predicted DNA-binding transcriptional regulator AlpA